MMDAFRRRLSAPLAILLLTTGTGCPFRKERINIAADGSIVMELEYSGSPRELDGFDALPSARTGWTTRRVVEDESDGEGGTRKKATIYARQAFAPGATLPKSLAEPRDPAARLALEFPTTVRFEDRADGRYVTFRRVYTPRRWAYVNYWEQVFIDDEIKTLSAKPIETLSLEERGKIVEALAAVQAFRQMEFADEALPAAFPDAPIEQALKARRALLDVYEKDNDYFRVVLERCRSAAPDERDACFQTETDRVLAAGYSAYVDSFRTQVGVDPSTVARFERAYERARRYYEITNDLGTHRFEIKVAVPGEVVAHNGDHVDNDGKGQTVTFGFDGRAFRDRTHELIVVSRLAPSPERR